jgi:hypothetical protein
MTLRQTEILGKKLVKYGFYRSRISHHEYTFITKEINVKVQFQLYFSSVWVAHFTHDITVNTRVRFEEQAALFTPEWVIDEHKKLRAIFKFLGS